MRKLFVGLGMAGLILAGSSEAMAQKTPTSKELNERIKALRSRLQDFQMKSVRNTDGQRQVSRESVELILDQPDVKVEKIVEELENRKDVAVTVLFHDADSAQIPDTMADMPAIGDEVAPEPAVVVASAKTGQEKTVEKQQLPDPALIASAAAPEDNRVRRYEDLRRRVYEATSRARSQAGEIKRQVASLP